MYVLVVLVGCLYVPQEHGTVRSHVVVGGGNHLGIGAYGDDALHGYRE